MLIFSRATWSTCVHDKFVQEHGTPDVIITDPPRAGMHEKLVHKITEMRAPVVVYVSCNPATQARDLNLLKDVYEVTVDTTGRYVSAYPPY